MLNREKLTDIQAKGLRWVDSENMGLNRRGGAGPTDHKALDFESQTVMIPVFNEQVHDSPFTATMRDGNTALVYEGEAFLGEVNIPGAPKFYQLSTEDGIPYSKIATLHSKDVLATTVLQTCVRYRSRETSCQFCAIEESLKSGATISQKTPQQLAEVAKAAVELDGVKQMILTTGTPKTSDRGAALLSECARAIKAEVNIPLQAQCEPPADDYWFGVMKTSGIDALGMHLEAVSDRVRKSIMPGKASVPLSRYLTAYERAVEIFGEGNVSTYILAGLGDTEQEIIEMGERLINLGVYPFVVPFVPVAGTPLASFPAPKPEMMDRIFSRLGPKLRARGITSETLSAGCAKCGACSSLKSYE